MGHVARGRFVWHELLTGDPGAAEEFYGALLGWSSRVSDDGLVPYTTFSVGGVPHGGIAPLPEGAVGESVDPLWFGYAHAPDVDAAAAAAEAGGGEVIGGPFDLPGIGRVATLRDPAGALISAFAFATPERHRDPPPGPGTFCWHELRAPEPGGLAPFYAALLGWRAETVALDGRDHLVMHVGDVPVAGLAAADPEHDGEPRWRVSIEVADVDAAARSAQALGGRVVAAPAELAVGRHALLADPQGAEFAVFRGRARDGAVA